MRTLAEIEAALPTLSPDELARVEMAARLLRQGETDARFDGQSWPSTTEEITIMLAELDVLPPLLSPDEADRFDSWHTSEKERQKAFFHHSGQLPLFS